MTKKVRVLFVPADPSEPVAERFVDPSCEGIQAVVGGYFEIVWLAVLGDISLYVNEEGIGLGLPVNERLSRVLGLPLLGQPLLGDGFLADDQTDEEEMVDISDEDAKLWKRKLEKPNLSIVARGQ